MNSSGQLLDEIKMENHVSTSLASEVVDIFTKNFLNINNNNNNNIKGIFLNFFSDFYF